MRLRICNSPKSSRSVWHPEWSLFHRPSMDYPEIILRGWSQSSNGVAHNEEMSKHEENSYPLGSASTQPITEIAPVCTDWHPAGELSH
ncbi:hypothetical protein TNCV_1882171 [Trichonephila clavipes]|nr:hypothetical protein TNCV_1882171 [Trichonephila clavipes]